MLNNYTCQECKMKFDQKINYNKHLKNKICMLNEFDKSKPVRKN